MNARTHTFELSVEGRQVSESVSSIFHTLLFHRTMGKFHYKHEESYSVGTIGFEDVPCHYIDFTYVRVSSDRLLDTVQKEVNCFSEALKSSDGPYSGKISLEFFQKRRGSWLFTECTPWEIWTLHVNVITLPIDCDRGKYEVKLSEMLAEKVFCIANAMNRQEYVPKMPSRSEIDSIFDTTYSDIQPYLHKITHQTSGLSNASVGKTVRKIMRDLAF